MAGDAKKLQPIVVKRIKKAGHAAHGGAWKIAYADFVTAMMAFFLLMWLLGSTTEGDRKGIADYFANPVQASLSGGRGSGDTTSIVTGGGQDLTQTAGQVRRGEAKAQRRSTEVESFRQEQRRAEADRLKTLQRKVTARVQASERLAQMGSQLLLEMTPDGLRIQIVDAAQRPMFASGSAAVQPYLRELLRELGGLLAEVPNRLTLEGHTDALPFAGNTAAGSAADAQRGYGNWELSADRANAARRELIAGGLPDDQVLRVQGLAASIPFDRTDATAASNRRIAVVVMTREAEEALFRSAAPLPTEPQVPAPPAR